MENNKKRVNIRLNTFYHINRDGAIEESDLKVGKEIEDICTDGFRIVEVRENGDFTVEPVKRESWFFTFGFDQKHAGKFVVFEDMFYSEARTEMIKQYGKEWGFQYGLKDWIKDDGTSQAEMYNLKRLK